MASSLSREDLLEELTVQGVMLKSMQHEDWDGIEQERKQVMAQIERLKDQLRQTRDPDHDAFRSQSAATRPGARLSASGPSDLSLDQFIASDANNSPFEVPLWPADRDVVAASTSSPDRKRKRNSHQDFSRPFASSDGQRHRAPSVGMNSSGQNDVADGIGDPIGVIDLTGDDVDLDASVIAEQINQAWLQEQRQEQEKQDRLMALTLENQPSPASSSHLSTPTAQRKPFTGAMGAQPLNVNRPIPGAWPTPSSTAPVHNPARDPWASRMGSTPGSPWQILPYQLPTTPSNTKHHIHINQPYMHMPSMAGPSGLPYSSPLPYNPIPSSTPTPRFLGSAPRPYAGGDSLARVIQSTSMYDFANGLKPDGDSFDSRLANFFEAGEGSAMTGTELDDLLKNIQPDLDLSKFNREKGPEGLVYPLYLHQAVALRWMQNMEKGSNKGGILADDMGLGKTISLLALMLANPASTRPKTNLIIGPLSLIQQWDEEIKTKTRPPYRPKVYIHHGKKSTTDELMRWDVVLTTYGTLAMELKRYDKYMEDNADRNVNFKDRATHRRFPMLHPSAVFHRVILDEAQCIKNRNTQTAKACHRLNATYRWCLTGTPMMNGIIELFSLLKFLHIKPYDAWDKFRQTFGELCGMRGDPKGIAMDRLRALLKAVMLRRKKDSELDGKPIIQLPPKTEDIVYAELSTDERDFYNQLESKAQVEFNKYLRDGTVGKNYSHILVLLLRLRQACCHPHLNLDVADAPASVDGESEEALKELVRNLHPVVVERIKNKDSFECPICYDVAQAPLFFIPCGHDSCKECLTRVDSAAIQRSMQEEINDDRTAKCPVCRQRFNPKRCFTYEMFQNVFNPDTVEAEDAGGDSNESGDDFTSDDEDSEGPDKDDDADEKGNLKGFVVADDESDTDLADLEQLKKSIGQDQEPSPKAAQKTRRQKKRKGKGKGKDKGKDKAPVKASMLKSLRKEAAKNHAAHRRYIDYLRKTWLPAAKVTECMRLLRDFAAQGDKTIVFSQWTIFLDLLQVAIWHDGLPDPLRYDGVMSRDQRADAAKKFRTDPDAMVMLVSLRTGNAGLNLVAANRVIIMDPFWNPYIEMQAIDRTYRIGQQRKVYVYRILTHETVEDRIVELQSKKKEIVEAALDEDESLKIGQLNVAELKFLFNGR